MDTTTRSAPTLPWEDPHAAEPGRARYAAEHARADLGTTPAEQSS
jgi:hypothetical protein